jgi:hypothetical protein
LKKSLKENKLKKLSYCIICLFCIFCMINCKKTDKLVLPSKVDLTQYIKENIKVEYPDIPSWGTRSDVRIWGWSKTGKIAFSQEYINPENEEDIFVLSEKDSDFSINIYVPSGKKKLVPAHINRIEYYILDVINDEFVFDCSWNPFQGKDNEDPIKMIFYMSEKGIEELFNIQYESILEANNKHGIIYNKTELLAFPLKNNNLIYNCHVDFTYRMEDEGAGDTIDNYDIIVSRDDGKSKKITSGSLYDGDFNFWSNIHICGCLKSPYENRIVVIYAEECQGLGEGLFWGFSGCHLDVGFNKL